MPSRILPGISLNGFWGLGEPWKAGGDENWLKLSVLTQLVVESITDPLPSSPSDGYIAVVPSGTDAGKVAVRDNGEWVYLPVPAGTRAWVKDENIQAVFDGTDWIKPMYGQSNIVGTVSQESGVPTGAIIESGSNANGEYVRFADGTQICRKTVHLDAASNPGGTAMFFSTISAGTLEPFPAAFQEVFGGSVALETNTAQWGQVNFTPGGLSAFVASAISRTSGVTANVMIFGRWF